MIDRPSCRFSDGEVSTSRLESAYKITLRWRVSGPEDRKRRAFLASDDASWVTGVAPACNGGFLAQ